MGLSQTAWVLIAFILFFVLVGKKLWSSANQGELVKLNCYRTGKEEAQGISDIMEQKRHILLSLQVVILDKIVENPFHHYTLDLGLKGK